MPPRRSLPLRGLPSRQALRRGRRSCGGRRRCPARRRSCGGGRRAGGRGFRRGRRRSCRRLSRRGGCSRRARSRSRCPRGGRRRRSTAGISWGTAWRALRADDTRTAGVIASTAFAASATTRHDESCSNTESGDAAQLHSHSVATGRAPDPDVHESKSEAISRRSHCSRSQHHRRVPRRFVAASTIRVAIAGTAAGARAQIASRWQCARTHSDWVGHPTFALSPRSGEGQGDARITVAAPCPSPAGLTAVELSPRGEARISDHRKTRAAAGLLALILSVRPLPASLTARPRVASPKAGASTAPPVNRKRTDTAAPARRRARLHRRARRARAQPRDRRAAHPQAPARGVHRRLRLGQVVAGVRHALRRGAAPLRRVAVGVRAAVPGPDGEAARTTSSAGCRRPSPSSRSRRRRNPRSTVGTVTEIYDYLRVLYARAGEQHCHLCGGEVAGPLGGRDRRRAADAARGDAR